MMKLNRTPRGDRGFTLVELLITVVIIAILTAIAIPAYITVVASAQDTAAKQNLASAISAQDIYTTSQATAGKYTDITGLSTAGLIKFGDPTKVQIVAGNGCYVAAALSATGKVFYVTDQNKTPTTTNPGNSCATILPFVAPTILANGGVVTVLVGNGGAAYADGTGLAARFNINQSGIAVDSAGTVYLADTINNRIRKTTAAGVMTTFAGSGVQGSADGTGTSAQFSQPHAVATDAAGNVYVADGGNQLIRKITPSGIVTTLAGGTVGTADGTGATAQFNYPYGIAADGSGTVYVADNWNNSIRKVTPAGVVTTLAGSTAGVAGFADGNGSAARFNNPTGVAVDSSGNVYVADCDNQRIRKITAAGLVSTLAGTGVAGNVNGPGASAQFSWPAGVAVDAAGTVTVADQANNIIRQITPSGVVSTLAGSGAAGLADGTGTAAQFWQPYGVAVDASGTVYELDRIYARIRRIR